ncbi:MAG TPA: efflux RND transporter periplasmic adaptor subunit [Ideonella sp.]|uniref:efflux RND transporter periplasmic adaptor subunit n=1 Tax=Ideonella sp. TaxID=1929293 RepID=UPI002E30321E|nr:efflux RND transporter periplasmic adaptor subunit [Ideonella sp.]HEX5686784.1 efflux RND transporter periplasmic adaptor subunit [Ideonella sp.]
MLRRRPSVAMPAHLPNRLAVGVAAGLLAVVLAGCSKGAGNGQAAAKPGTAASAPPTLLLSAEDLRIATSGLHAVGPVITGSIQPERRADLRAEVSAVVLQVLKDNGETVRKGDLLVRLDDTAIRDSLASAEEASRASAQSVDQAERQYQRLRTLQAQGMSSMQAMEDAEIRRNNAHSDLVATKSRVAAARQQLQRTEVRAPFDGVVSDRKVSAGDTAQVGKELVKVIDPTSMRFEGLVSSDRMGEIKPGQSVSFRINGFGQQEFNGKVRRVDASANASTRQVEVLVGFEGGEMPRVSGLYAEGLVATGGQQALMLPEAALAREGDNTFVWRVKSDTLSKVKVKLGERDQRSGDYVVLAGLAEGDQVLRRPNANLVDGQKVERKAVAASSPAPATPAASSARS